MPTTIRRLYYGWVVLIALLIIGIISYGIRFSFGVFFKSLEEEFVLSRALTSSVFSAFNLFICVFAILGGWALDRYGPKIVFLLMGFFTGLSLLLTSVANATWHLFVSYSLLLAIGSGPIYVTMMATASKWFTKRRGLALGIVGTATGIGTMMMAPISTFLIGGYGWRASYFVMALMALFITVPCSLLLKKAPSELAALPDNSDVTKPSVLKTEDISLPLLAATKTKNFWLVFAIEGLQAFCIFLIMVHIVPHAIDLGIPPPQAASILSLIGGTVMLGRLLMGRISDSIGRKQAMMVCTLLMTGAMMWLIWSSNLWMLYLFAIVFGFAYGGFGPSIVALTAEIFGLRHVGTIMGALEIGWSSGAILGPALAGYIFDISGNYTAAFLAGIVAILLIVVLIPFLRPPRRLA